MPHAASPTPPPLDVRDTAVAASIDLYWARNLRIMAVLLVIWALAGLGCGILFADSLHGIRIGGFPLGFWFAQQGSVVIYVLLILVYALLLNRLDDRHRVELAQLRARPRKPPSESASR